jgi:hypothetical protein
MNSEDVVPPLAANMSAAFKKVRAAIGASWARKRVASMIFDLAMAGETDEKRLATRVLAEFRLEGHHRTSRPIG